MTRLTDFAKRTVFGADGTDYHKSGVGGFFADAFEAAAGFAMIIGIPCLLECLYFWIFG